MSTFSPSRALAVYLFIAALMTGLIGRVIVLQTYGRQQTLERAERQQHTKETIAARRGGIFDATGML
ncbi:MAG TPA: hypothetical protein VER17_08590, partial [Tepidisphaeraceae bacterium]|nr:hypothetical protein [Tepidisphaeraceae bacterium]